MNSYEETFQTWNKIATLYQDKFMDLDLYNNTYRFFAELITKKNSKILEIGCGPGNITKYLLENRPDFKITAIDIAPNMIELAKKNNPKAVYKVLDCRDITSLKNKFDAIIAGFCIPYISKTACTKLINDCNSLLSNSGIFYVSFIAGNYKNSGYQTDSSGNRIYFYYHSLNTILNTLEIANFEIIKSFQEIYKKTDKTFETHTILIAKKM